MAKTGNVEITFGSDEPIMEILDLVAPETRKILDDVTTKIMEDAKKDWPIRRRNSQGSVNDFRRGISVSSDSVVAYVENTATYAWAIKSGAKSVNQSGNSLLVPLGRRVADELMWKPARQNADRVAEIMADELVKRLK